MLLTKHADYAVRVLTYLAARPGEKVSISTIADEYGISRNHLMKVSQNLARHGYIIGYRGKGGGIALARPARTINLAHVLQKMENNLKPDAAVTGGETDSFQRILEEARTAFLGAIEHYTLADLLSDEPETPQLARVAGPARS